jgi:hypothetical protein
MSKIPSLAAGIDQVRFLGRFSKKTSPSILDINRDVLWKLMEPWGFRLIEMWR